MVYAHRNKNNLYKEGMALSRKLSRIAIMQILFAMDHGSNFSEQVMENFFDRDWEEDEIKELYRQVFSGDILKNRLRDLSNQPFTKSERAYITQSVRLLLENRETIDRVIQGHLKDWSMHRIAAVDLSILRVAVSEMLYHDDIAPAVAINEAVDLAKIYSTPDSARFINGILGYIVREGNYETY